jgi:hypothetical protein
MALWSAPTAARMHTVSSSRFQQRVYTTDVHLQYNSLAYDGHPRLASKALVQPLRIRERRREASSDAKMEVLAHTRYAAADADADASALTEEWHSTNGKSTHRRFRTKVCMGWEEMMSTCVLSLGAGKRRSAMDAVMAF